LVADIFFKIWDRRKNIEIKSSVKGYLFFAARNHALNFLNKKEHTFHDIEEFSQRIPSETPIPSETIISNENVGELHKKIQGLPPQRQKVFIMNKIEGFTYAEIASKLSLSEKTVRNQVQIAVRNLKSFLATLVLYLLPFI